MLCHGHTYARHPAVMAAALATLEVYEGGTLTEPASEVGEYLGDQIDDLAATHPSVGEAQDVGFFRTIELTKHPEKPVPVGGREVKISQGTTVVDEVSTRAREH